MARRSTPPPPSHPANLSAKQIEAAIQKLEKRLEELMGVQFDHWDDTLPIHLDGLHRKLDQTLVDVFGEDTPDYGRYQVLAFSMMVELEVGAYATDPVTADAYKRQIAQAIEKVRNAIDMLQERRDGMVTTPGENVVPPIERAPDSGKVFVVHGHDEEAKQSVARFLERIDLEPIILHEQPDKGRTVIEKFEQNAEPVGFAVVIATPDDVGASGNQMDKLQPRARQNVVLELGYFVGRLGRDKVCVLKKGGIEMPSDYIGVVYKELDANGAWKIELAQELHAAGFEVNFEKVVIP